MARTEAEPAGVGESIRVELLRAWPRRFVSTALTLPAGATVADALAMAGVSLDSAPGASPDAEVAVAVFGERVDLDDALSAGDRIELLRPLRADPKEARRKRAKTKASAA